MSENDTQSQIQPLPANQQKALEALLSGKNASDTATAAGVSRQTLYRWLKSDLFRQALADGERLALDGFARGLAALGDTSLATLRAALEDKSLSGYQRAKLALAINENLLKLREIGALESRVIELEKIALLCQQ